MSCEPSCGALRDSRENDDSACELTDACDRTRRPTHTTARHTTPSHQTRVTGRPSRAHSEACGASKRATRRETKPRSISTRALANARATRDMAHSELKAYSSDEEIEDAHEDEIRCVCAPSFTHRRGDRARRRISPRSSPAERARSRFVPCQRASSVSARIPSSDRDILPPFSNAVRSRSSRNCRPGCAGWTPWSSTDRGCPRARRDGGRGSSQKSRRRLRGSSSPCSGCRTP